MTSLCTSGWQLSKFKNVRKCRIRQIRCCISCETLWGKITKFYKPIQADMTYNGAGYDVTNCFRSEATAKKPSKMPHQTSSGGISREWFRRGSPNFARLSGTAGPRNLPDMTSLLPSRRLQNAIKYCPKVMRKTGPPGQSVTYFGHCLTQTRHMLQGHPCRRSLRPHRIWTHQLLPIGIYRSSKNRRKFRLRRLWVDV